MACKDCKNFQKSDMHPLQGYCNRPNIFKAYEVNSWGKNCSDFIENSTPKLLEIDKAIEVLKIEYEKAKLLSFVRNPLAYALYHTWKKFDKE